MIIKHYIAIARPDHWTKNIFVLPGTIIISQFLDIPFHMFAWKLFIGLISTCLIASANYVINEWLDAEFDRFHPTKKFRPSVSGDLRWYIVYSEYLLLGVLGLWLASTISIYFFYTAAFLLTMGIIYNVKPIRTKDLPLLDVLSESINNPIRLALGWFIVSNEALPPSSLVISYWMGGAYLMAIKRFSEYRFISDKKIAGAYRKSFKYYTEENLLISAFFYAMSCGLFLGVFLVKYRIELLLGLPFVAILFAWYLHIAFKSESPVQHPERLHEEHKFMAYCILFIVIFFILLRVDLPFLKWFLLNAFMIKSPVY